MIFQVVAKNPMMGVAFKVESYKEAREAALKYVTENFSSFIQLIPMPEVADGVVATTTTIRTSVL